LRRLLRASGAAKHLLDALLLVVDAYPGVLIDEGVAEDYCRGTDTWVWREGGRDKVVN